MPAPTVSLERLKASRCQLTVTFDPADVVQAEERTLLRLGEKMTLPGFRPGKAPASTVRERVNGDQLFEETIRMLLESTLPGLLTEHAIQPVIPPKVDALSRTPLTLRIIVVEQPAVTLKHIDGLKIAKKKASADPKDVQRVIDSVLQEHRTLTLVDRASATGDQAVITFTATNKDGVDIPGLRAASYPVTLGSSRLLPGFEDELSGLKAGDKKSFALTLPDNYGDAALKGQKVTFHVEVQRVEEVKLPELTDTFAKDMLKQESVAAFKAMVETSIAQQEQELLDLKREQEFLEELKKRVQVEIAPELMEDETKAIVDEWVATLERQGKKVEDVLKHTGKTAEQMMKDFRKQADDRIRLRLGIAKLIDERKVTLDDNERSSLLQDALADVPDEERAQAERHFAPGNEGYAQLIWRGLVQKAMKEFLE